MGYWKNPSVPLSKRYVPAKGEHIANIVTQAISVTIAVPLWLYVLSQVYNSTYALTVFFLHGLSYILMFLISMQFHIVSLFEWGTPRMIRWHLYDRLVIYFIIAAGYTPWLTIPHLHGLAGMHMWWLVWALGILGAVYSIYLLNWSKVLETTIYTTYGVLPFWPLYTAMVPGIEHIVYGGIAIIIIGVPLFKLDGHVPCSHALWHVCVSVGCLWHCWAAYTYLVPIAMFA
ncbi:monocyte to macrophage differentiation factor 2-like [Sycon ciliatum]|uniref:monocyte to macrophage differentiation factor 2-like n=1 Tax=Sycon ciliatum TaxID=27933 RepID=UPI0020AC9A80|eukprot:scpid75799/ scgid18317/ Monocyte to macrophage differentiation factor 2; Progestin and adipoQ receptor family member X